MSDSTPVRPTADRNLLFGILALQMDFVSRDALIAAMNAWVLDKAKPLGQILLKQGALRPDTHALLEALVRKHLEMHDGDPRKSLAAVNSLGSVREQIRQVSDAELHASLAHVSAARKEDADPFSTRPPSAGTPTSAGLRFRVLRPHARGGLGEVFVAHDEELRREVALKEIQDRYADDPHSRSRFVLEAEVTGGLEHPGIVPVYGLGQYADGRPFYAMRFVRGDSLHDAIERFHKADSPGRDPGERSLALRGLLGRFVDVCDAVAYAHSRGVLHRDLKPGNVMLGHYGETLVVDWGLAKPVGAAAGDQSATQGPLQPAAASGSPPTQMGSVFGTPQYMPPEQAAGRLDLLGAASDVYSLGATLYCLLTGKAPVEGQDRGAVLQKVQRGDFPPPRQVKREVPRALEAVCLKAMALRPEGRYPTPRALAADVEHWLADEPVSAWREPWRARAGRWARRHQALTAAVAAGLLVALLGGGAGALWLQRQRAERREEAARQEGALRQDVEGRLGQAARLRQGGQFFEARELLNQARQRLGADGPTDLRGQVDQALADARLAEQLDDARQRASTSAGGKWDLAGAERGYLMALRDGGVGRESDDENPEAVGARVRASAVRAELVAALDDWAGITRSEGRREWLLAVARAADPDPLRDRLRQPALWRDKAALAREAGLARVAELSPQLAAALGWALLGNGGDALPLLREAQARHPNDFWLNFLLGRAFYQVKEWDEAIGCYRAALALRPSSNAVHNDLGAALRAKGRFGEAARHFREAVRVDPTLAHAHYNLGNALRDLGKAAEAAGHFEEALRLGHKNAQAHHYFGMASFDKGRFGEAARHFREAVRIDPTLAHAHYNLGNALYGQGKASEAAGHFEEALRLGLGPDDAQAHNNLGTALYDQGKVAEAVRHFREAVRIDPTLARAHHNLGDALYGQGKPDEAIRHCEAALRLGSKSARTHYSLGRALHYKGRLVEAVGHYEEALRIDPKLAEAHCNLGQALRQQGRFEEALACWKRGHELGAKQPGWRYPSDQWVRDAERLVALDRKLPAVLRGEVRPADAAEQLGLADVCTIKKRYAAAAHFYATAFGSQPKLAADLKSGHRYNAACSAALAAAGQGTDGANPDAEECARLREQVLDWLRSDLGLWAKQAERGKAEDRAEVQQKLRHWGRDPDLAGVRDAAALAKLPEAERADWQKLWADVAALLQKVGAGEKK